MANNKIQIKRSIANSAVTGLSNGELAFTQASNTLWIGLPDGSGTAAIGGVRNPGVLTANQALVVNATSGIDQIIVANAVITNITANGVAGSNGQVLVTNGTAVYWGTGTSGTNTQVQFNDSGVANGSAGFTFIKTSNTLAVANTITTSNLFATGTVNASILSIGSSSLANSTGVFTTGSVNGSVVSVGSNFIANTTQVTVGTGVGFAANGTVGSANQVLRTNGTSIYWSDDVGDISAITAGNGLTGGGTSGDITLDVGAGSGVYVDTNAVGVLANNGIIANTTGTWVHAATGVYVNSTGVGVLANNGIVSNTSGTWVQAANGTSVDSSGVNVVAGTGVTVNTSGVHIGQAVGTTDNVSFANVVTGLLSATGNVAIGDAITDIVSINSSVNTNIMPSANLTYNVGNNTFRWNEIHAGNVHSISGYFDGSIYVSGDVNVTGNLVTTNVQSVVISDPMIYLAGNNYTSDLVDIGFAANYFDGSKQRHTGLYRSFSDGEYRLFTGSEQELEGNNTVNATANGYTLAILHTYLIAGGLTVNSTSANLSANSTWSVNIVANTLSLSTALAGNSGGTGKATVTNHALLVGNSTNGYNELTLGTSGYVLQSNGTTIVYDVLDGGSF